MNKTPVAIAFAAIALPLSAQTYVVSPAEYANIEASGSNAFPFGTTTQQFRYLNVHDDMAGPARQILAFSLRKGATTTNTVTPATTVVMDGWMSTAVTTGATVNANFDANHGSDKTQVLTNRTVNFPPYGTEIIPYPFIYTVPLDVPFNFGGTGPLCWEVQITSRPAGASMFHDYVGGSATNPSFAVSRYGADGCIATGRTQAFALTGGSSVTWSNLTGQLTATASQGPANAPALYAFGMSGTSHFGVPLPAQLPNTAGFPSGACFLNTELLFTVFGTLSSAGGATFRLDLPLDPSFGGTNLFGQVAALDASANALGLVTTNGINHHIVAPHGNPPGGRIYLSGSLGATGNVGANQTLVVQFTTP